MNIAFDSMMLLIMLFPVRWNKINSYPLLQQPPVHLLRQRPAQIIVLTTGINTA